MKNKPLRIKYSEGTLDVDGNIASLQEKYDGT